MQKIRQNIQTLERIDQLIYQKRTGNATELAELLGVHVNTVYGYIQLMREEFEAPIRFDNTRNSYVYDCEGRLICEIGFKSKKN